MSDDLFSLDLGSIPEDNTVQPPSGWRHLTRGGALRCVFSTTTTVDREGEPGPGVGQRFLLVTQISKDQFRTESINNHHLPEGSPRLISLDDLISDYVAEVAYTDELVLPTMADKGLAEMGTLTADNLPPLFGLGLIYLSRNEEDRARDLFRDLLKVRGEFGGRGHHLFNELGILLRKSNLLDLSMAAFARALDFVADDENLYYNLARAHYENDDWDGCMANLIESHRLNPGLTVARDLLGLVVGLHEDPSLLGRYGKPPVPESTASRARDLLEVDSGKLTLDESPISPVSSIEPGRARFGGKGVVTFRRHGKKK